MSESSRFLQLVVKTRASAVCRLQKLVISERMSANGKRPYNISMATLGCRVHLPPLFFANLTNQITFFRYPQFKLALLLIIQ